MLQIILQCILEMDRFVKQLEMRRAELLADKLATRQAEKFVSIAIVIILGIMCFATLLKMVVRAKHKVKHQTLLMGDTYIVQAGDSLWSIAEKVYGSGAYYTKLMTLNGLTNANIMVGQVLKIKSNTPSVSQPAQSTSNSNSGLPTLRKGSKGEPVRALQALLILRGQKLISYGTDGDFGNETEIALRAY